MKGDFEMQKKIEERSGSNRFLLFMYTAVFRFKMYYTYSKKNILLRFFLAYRSVSKKDFLTDLSHPKYILLFFWAYRSVSKKKHYRSQSPKKYLTIFFAYRSVSRKKIITDLSHPKKYLTKNFFGPTDL